MPYFYLIFYRYKIESQLKKSILINTALSLAGFFVTQKMIPIASTYVLRRNLFGFDINKKGTSQKFESLWELLLELSFWLWSSYFSTLTSQHTQIGLLSTMRR